MSSDKDDEWNESFETNEDEDSRINFYQQVCEGDDTTSYNELVKLIRGGKLNTKPVSLPSLKAEREWTYHKITLKKEQMEESLNERPPQQVSEKKEKFAWKLPSTKEPEKVSIGPEEVEEQDSLPTVDVKLPRLLTRGANRQKQEDDVKKSPARVEQHRERDDSGERPSFKNTKMCKHGARCTRQGQGCNYAHSMKDFSPVSCKFKSCRKGNACTYFHPETESKEAFLQRISRLN